MIEKIQKQAAPELVAAVKSGTISLNAASRRGHPARWKNRWRPPLQAKTSSNKPPSACANQAQNREEAALKCLMRPRSPLKAPTDELPALRARVAELTAENEALRQQLAQLRATLGRRRPAVLKGARR